MTKDRPVAQTEQIVTEYIDPTIKPQRNHWVLFAGAGAFLLLAGVGIGSAANDITPMTKPLPAVTKTVTNTVTNTVTSPPVINTVTKKVTPQSCIDALNMAGEFANNVAQEHRAFSEAADRAQVSGDVVTFLSDMSDSARKLTDQSSSMAPRLAVLSVNCRAGK